MIKKLFLVSLVVSQLAVSCTNNDNPENSPEGTLQEQVANIVKQPYSKLTPTEQKVKLEAEANEMLVQLDKSKSSGAIEAIENLERLLEIESVDIFGGKNDNKIENILNTADVYGIYTWNNSKQIWIKTTSTTELQFVFPAKKSQTANNAIFSSKSVASDIKVKIIDTYANWTYNPKTDQYIKTPDINDSFFLPTSADAVLTIDKVQAATFAQTAKYSNGKETPVDFSYKMSVNDGYSWEMSSKKEKENTTKASFTYNGKNLIEFNVGSTAEIDKLIDNDAITSYRGKANGLIKIMDNFIIVADMDLATEAADEAALEKNYPYPIDSNNYNDPKANYKAYYTGLNNYYQKNSEGTVANFNKNIKLILVSKKDGTKIADVVQRTEKEDSYTFNLPVWNSKDKYWEFWAQSGEAFTQQYYDEVFYLKFNDNTEVAMSAYFSKGFEKLETKFEDFIKAFNRK